MRSVRLGLFLLLTCGACGDPKVPSAPASRPQDSGVTDFDSGYSNNSGRGGGGAGGASAGGGGGGMGGNGPDAGPDLLAPSLSFLTPTAASSPDSEDVITVTSLSVRCKVEGSTDTSAAKVDKSAVKIAIQNPTDESIFIDGAVSAVSDTEFEATFDVSDRKNGQLKFQCRAKDVRGEHAASKELTTLIDLGPTITLSKPQDKHRYALKTPMAIEFTVKPAPLADGDDQADVKGVTLNVGGVDTPITESKDMPGVYQTSIDFSDKTKFPVQPDSVQLAISATNSRANAPTRVARAVVSIDGTGPAISVVSPPNASIQRGVVALSVNVSDPSGIMPGTLIATINTQPYSSWDGTAPNFVLSFDTNQLDPMHELTQLTINITAIDGVGNKTDPPVSHLIRLDNVPPIIALDPPPIIEAHKKDNVVYCSQPYDPVGSLAANDLQKIPNAQIFRAQVEDRTNNTTGTSFLWHAGVNPGLVEMYTQGLTDYPLLVDTNGDGFCDAINKSDDMNIRDAQRVTPDKDPVKIMLNPVNPNGVAWFAKADTMGIVTTPGCPNDPNGLATVPDPVCHDTEMIRTVPAPLQGRVPSIYAFVPSNDVNIGQCNGESWNIKGNTRFTAGWICVAARAADNIGNVGVSEPLRLCFSSDGTGDCPGPIPSCRGKDDNGNECTFSPSQKFANGIREEK